MVHLTGIVSLSNMSYKNIISGIYTITNTVNGKIYVGKAVNIGERLNCHKSKLRNGKHDNAHLQRAWNKYGQQNFLFEILEECSREFLCSFEHYWCNLLNVHNDDCGYNFYPTSPTCTSKIRSESIELRTKTRKKNAILRGFWVPDNYIKQLKQSKSVHPNLTKVAFDRFSKKVMKLDVEGNEVQSYNSMAEAAKKNSTTSERIRLVCKGQQKTTGGFKWKFII